jgi:hypothetical protein
MFRLWGLRCQGPCRQSYIATRIAACVKDMLRSHLVVIVMSAAGPRLHAVGVAAQCSVAPPERRLRAWVPGPRHRRGPAMALGASSCPPGSPAGHSASYRVASFLLSLPLRLYRRPSAPPLQLSRLRQLSRRGAPSTLHDDNEDGARSFCRLPGVRAPNERFRFK